MYMFGISKFGFDFGSSSSLISAPHKGVLVNDPSVVALSMDTKTIIAVGNDAKDMLGKTPEGVISKNPIKFGAISNYKIVESMIRYFLSKAGYKSLFFNSEAVVGISDGLTSVEKRAMYEAVMGAGIKKIYLVPNVLLTAIGCNLPIGTSSGNMVINIGGGTAELAVISFNGIVVSDSIRVGGDSINEAICIYLKKNYGIIIGDQMAENIKIEVGSALPLISPIEMEIRGRDAVNGMPKSMIIDTNVVVSAIKGPLNLIIQSTRHLLERTPPELASDIIDRGILLSGGTSLLRNIDTLITRAIGITAYISDDPVTSVVNGASEALKYIDILYKNVRNP